MKNFDFADQFDLVDEPVGQIQATLEKIEAISKLARKCLANNDFQQYKELFEKEKDAIINAMVIYTARFGKTGYENINVYAFTMLRFVQQITDLRKLLTAVELDAKKSIQQGNEDGKV